MSRYGPVQPEAGRPDGLPRSAESPTLAVLSDVAARTSPGRSPPA
jgi:hypothetical protein